MKRKHLRSALFLAAVIPVTSAASAQVVDYFWQQNAPAGGSGTWDTATANWATAVGNANTYTWTNNGLERANFVSGTGTMLITVDGAGITSAGVVITVAGTNTYSFNGPGTLTLLGGSVSTAGSTTFSAVVAGTDGLIKTGVGTLTLAAANTLSGTTSVIGSGLVGIAQTSGQPFSSGPMMLSGASVRLNGIASSTTTTIGDLTAVAVSQTVSGASNLILDNSAGGGSALTTLAAGNLVRGGGGSALVITPVTGALGTGLGSGEALTFSGGTTLTNGILPPWVVANVSGANTATDFVTYGANGVSIANYTSTDLTTSTGSSVVNQNTSPVIGADVSAYALKTNQQVNLQTHKLTLGNGSGQTGLILNNGGQVIGGNVDFGSTEGMIFVQGTTALGSAGNNITSNGLTITASGAATATINGNIVNGTSAAQVVLTGVTSGTSFTLGGNNTYTGGTIMSVNTGSTGNVNIASNTAFGVGKVTNILVPGTSSPQLQASGGARTLANAFDLNGGLKFTGTNAMSLNGPITIINSASGGGRTIEDAVSVAGTNVTFGASPGSSTITLGNPTANGGDGVGKTLTFSPFINANIVINDVMQDPPSGSGGGSVVYNVGSGGNNTTSIVTIAAQNTYTGSTFLNGTSIVRFLTDSNGGGTAGPFGAGTLVANSSNNNQLEPFGGNRTVANPYSLVTGFTVINASGDSSSVTFTGPGVLTSTTGRTIANNLAAGATMTLGSAGSPSTLTGSGTAGASITFSSNAATNFTVVNDVIRDNGSTALPIVIGNSNTVTFAALNTYSGGTNFNGGGTILPIVVSSNDVPSGSFTSGPFGVGQMNVNSGTNQHFRPIGGNRLISNSILMSFGLAMDNATGDPSNLTFAGAITMVASRFISNGFTTGTSGGTMVLGAASAPSTITLPTSTANTGLNLSLAALAGPIVVNDTIVNSAATGTAQTVAINPQTGDVNAVTLNGANTYTGGTTIGGGTNGAGSILLGVSSVGAPGSITSGPFGTGTVTMNQAGTPPIIIPIGADRTVANAITLTSGFFAANTVGAPFNLNFTGPMTLGATSRVITNNMVSGSALTLGDPTAPSTITVSSPLLFQTQLAAGTGGLTVINDSIGGSGGLGAQVNAVVNLMTANTYSGGTTLNSATIGLGVDSVGGPVTSGPLGIGTLTIAANGTLTALGGPRSVGNNITFTAGPLIVPASSNALNLGGNVDLNGADRTVQVDSGAGVTLSGSISGTTGVIKTGTGTLTLAGSNLYSGNTTMNNGVVSVSSSANLGDASATNGLVFNGGTLKITGPVVSASRNATLNGAGTIDVGATSSLGNFTGSGSLTKSGTAALTIKSARIGNLTVSAGTLAVAPNGTAAGASVVNSTSIASPARLDISDNHLVDHTTGAGTWTGANYTGLTGYVASGRNGNAWNGSGIVTSQTAAIGSNYTSVGVAKASDVRPATATATALWAGQTITGTDTLVMYTYGGDATLDGKINVDDYIRIDSGIAAGLTGWSNGDFNYDGKVNIDDYTSFIDANIGTQGPQFFTAGGGDTHGLAGGGASGVSAVPEPATLSLGAVGLAMALLPRRRRCRYA